MERLFLFHALGADERMFSNLGALPVEKVLPRLPIPFNGEKMEGYARRVSSELSLGERDFVGGCSFGGMVAAEIARQKKLQGLFLIGSGLSSHCISSVARKTGQLSAFLPAKLVRPILESESVFHQVFGPDIPPLYELARLMLRETSDEMLVLGGRLTLSYFPRKQVLCPVYAIHGSNDQAMLPTIENCQMVDGAGHGMVLTHSDQVTVFLKEVFDCCDVPPRRMNDGEDKFL